MKNDQDIKNILIIDESDYSRELAENFAKKIVKYAKISKNSEVFILNNSLSPDNKIRISLVLRFIAHTLSQEIKETISLRELANIISESLEATGSRLSKIMKNENFAKKVSKGIYIVNNFVIDKFLTDLENKDLNSSGQEKSLTHGKTRRRKNKTVTGIGKDILEILINGDFFKVPRTVKEAWEKLAEETKIYDLRIVDNTIRKTFVDNQRILRRIDTRNNPTLGKGKGKARWLYVNRK